MDETSKKVAKDPKRQERVKKSNETYMKRLKEQILEGNQLSTPSLTGNSTPFTPSSAPFTSSSIGNSTSFTPPHSTRPNDNYIYGVGILAVIATGVCAFFAYNLKIKNSSIKKMNQPPKRRHML